MNGALFGLVALGLLLICLWIWMNVMLTRPRHPSAERKEPRGPERGAVEPQAQAASAEIALAVGQGGAEGSPSAAMPASAPDRDDDASAAAAGVSADAGVPEDGSQRRSTGVDRTTPALGLTPAADGGNSRELEVVTEPPKTTTVFGRKNRPFSLNEKAAPQFGKEPWQTCFYKLCEDPLVLGWIAFYDDVVGASDHDYDAAFVEALRTYKQSVEQLRRQVGLTQIVETAVVGEEGKVWFLTPVEDTWMALFVDREADIEALSERLIAAVRPASLSSDES